MIFLSNTCQALNIIIGERASLTKFYLDEKRDYEDVASALKHQIEFPVFFHLILSSNKLRSYERRSNDKQLCD
jgi:hypothetical protein